MEASKGNIFELLNGVKQYIMPVYQRYYRWDIEQCRRLWDDVISMQREKKPSHFIGSIVNITETAMPMGIQRFVIIDGQQRLTTITLLLIALRDFAIAHPQDSSINPARIDAGLLKNESETGEDHYKLILTESDRDALQALVNHGEIAQNSKSRVLENYDFFASEIAKKPIPLDAIFEAIGRLQIVNITLDREGDNPQAIFESLNSTGKELSQADLIRNYMLMELSPAKQTSVYSKYWRPMELLFDYEHTDAVIDRFFRDYLTMMLRRIPKENQVYEEFKAAVHPRGYDETVQACKDLFRYAEAYTEIVFQRSDDRTTREMYKRIKSLQMESTYAFLMKANRDRADELISMEEYQEILRIAADYVLRRGVCLLPTNTYRYTFTSVFDRIDTSDYINSIKAFFLTLSGKRRFPTDEEFAAAFQNGDIYTLRLRNFILAELENFENKNSIAVENFTIEHIMPQNEHLNAEWRAMLGEDWKQIHAKYLHTIGNLTLTRYNSEMSDRPFNDKLEMPGGFIETGLRLNAYVKRQTEWTEKQIQERAAEMTAKALRLWPYPALNPSELEKFVAKEASPAYTIDHFDMRDRMRDLFEQLDQRITNLSSDVRREYLSQYIAYKVNTNFADIIPRKTKLIVFINMRFPDIYDPKGMCQDFRGRNHHANGEAAVDVFCDTNLDDVMAIVEQSFQIQSDS